MNEFIAKKIGEAKAFEEHTIWLLGKAKEAYSCFLTDIEIEGRTGDHEKNRDTIISIAESKGIKDQVEAKAEKTKAKLQGMAETYIGEKWNDTAEILEWTSFAEGAAIAHWGIVKGAAEALEEEALLTLSFDAIAEHSAHFDEAASELSGIGNTEALKSKAS